jgi:hypothetical protein
MIKQGASDHSRRFESAIFWPRDPAVRLPAIVMDDRMRPIRVSSEATLAQIEQMCFANLEAIKPEPGLIEKPN